MVEGKTRSGFRKIQMIAVATCDHSLYQSLIISIWTDIEVNCKLTAVPRQQECKLWLLVISLPEMTD